MKKKVKNIKLRIGIKGIGVVNYDGNFQKFIWNRESKKGNKNKFSTKYNNSLYAKKVYREIVEDGKKVLNYDLKISSSCLKKAIFSKYGDVNPSIVLVKSLLNSYISSFVGIVRGYVFNNDKEMYKRTSPLTITDAIQTSDSVSMMELFTRSGEKVDTTDMDESDTSLFNKETVGDIKYLSKGNISLSGMQFISADKIFDRFSFNSDDFGLYNNFLMSYLPNPDNELGYFNLKTSVIPELPEYGLKLNNDNVVFLVKETLKNILEFKINRNGSYAELDKFSVSLVDDALAEDEWLDINSYEDIDNLDFEVYDFYEKIDEKVSKEKRDILEASVLASKKKKMEKKKSNKSKTTKKVK